MTCPTLILILFIYLCLTFNECILQILLDYHSPYLPRADDDTTPLDLAENYEHADCVTEIGTEISDLRPRKQNTCFCCTQTSPILPGPTIHFFGQALKKFI